MGIYVEVIDNFISGKLSSAIHHQSTYYSLLKTIQEKKTRPTHITEVSSSLLWVYLRVSILKYTDLKWSIFQISEFSASPQGKSSASLCASI